MDESTKSYNPVKQNWSDTYLAFRPTLLLSVFSLSFFGFHCIFVGNVQFISCVIIFTSIERVHRWQLWDWLERRSFSYSFQKKVILDSCTKSIHLRTKKYKKHEHLKAIMLNKFPPMPVTQFSSYNIDRTFTLILDQLVNVQGLKEE